MRQTQSRDQVPKALCAGKGGFLSQMTGAPGYSNQNWGEPQKLCGYLRTFTVDELAGPPKVRADQGSITYYRMANS